MTNEEKNFRLIASLLYTISSGGVNVGTINSVASCLADGRIDKACQYVWGINPPKGIKVSGNFKYTISN